MAEDEIVSGTMIQGEEGEMYFIPDEDLANFKVPEEQATMARQALEDSDDVEGFAQVKQQELGIKIKQSVHGAIGTRPTMESGTILHVDPVALYGPKGL